MITPTPETDAAPPERGCKGLVFLAGAIKNWWLSSCENCGHLWEPADPQEPCPWCGDYARRELWGGPEHRAYVAWRNEVRAALVKAGYLTYAPHEAFKGTWTERAQAVNDAAIAAADLMVVMSPNGLVTEGTDAEVAYAERVGTPVVYAPPGSDALGIVESWLA